MNDYNEYIHGSCASGAVKVIPWPDPVPYTKSGAAVVASQMPSAEEVESFPDADLADIFSDIVVTKLKTL